MSLRPFLDLPPCVAAQGLLSLPGSKSISNRVLLLAGLCAGRTQIEGLLQADDTRVMLDALRALGCGVHQQGDRATIDGMDGHPANQHASLFLGNAGTAMRPLAAALAVMAQLRGGHYELHGVARMHERPIGDLTSALRAWGCQVQETGQPGYPPLRLQGEPGGALKLDAPVQVRGDVSSQFLTALLLAAPLATQASEVVFEVQGDLISKPYVEITLNLLARFGVKVEREAWSRFVVPQGSRYASPGTITVEGDASAASYFIGLGAMAAHGGRSIVIDGLGSASIQGDIRFVDAARAMGAQIDMQAQRLSIARGAWPLRAVELDCNAIPDAAMTLAVMALYAKGTTRLSNIASWRVKETDRIAAMAHELRKLGATVDAGEDFIAITPPASAAQWRAAAIHTYDDHRVAMSFSLAAFNPAGLPVRILDPGCVAKTYPGYFDDFFDCVQAHGPAVPVLTVDGPTASGKGTVASEVAKRLGYHHLDSGALYRATALQALRQGVRLDDAAALGELARQLPIHFDDGAVWLDGQDVSMALRREDVGASASRISALPEVRQALHALQHGFRRAPGLVADGRDMGTVIFPDAALKVFLTASAAKRAERRYKQLISKEISANIDDLRADLQARDARDQQRSASPMKPADDAQLLDNSAQSVDESVAQVLAWWAARSPFPSA